jgi:hypothetical protein
MDTLADFLLASGARPLEALIREPEPAPEMAQLL